MYINSEYEIFQTVLIQYAEILVLFRLDGWASILFRYHFAD